MHQDVPLCPALCAKHAASDFPVFQTPEMLLFPQPRFPPFHPCGFSHCAALERGQGCMWNARLHPRGSVSAHCHLKASLATVPPLADEKQLMYSQNHTDMVVMIV